MDKTIRILHLEDNRNDAELVQALLAGDGLAPEIVRVETHAEFLSALDRDRFDLIISDFSLPSYDGQSALRAAQDLHPDVPFIFFSGTIGEERAIDALRKGATDYVLKQRPTRLVAAVRRVLRESELKTERRQLEEHLRQAQKMEAIGQLTGGIAHDFNNLLTIINGYTEILLQTLPAGDPQRDNAVQVKEAGERAVALTRQLLAFSRRQILEPKVLDVNAVVTNLDKMLKRMIGEDITLAATLTPGLGRVKVDPGQLEQVIMNLAVNARDALPRGGTITVETSNVELDETFAQRHVVVKPGQYVMLAVSDTGCGMDAETQKRIFEPFFTTKGLGKGTGLGLSTVYGIVKQSGGSIWAYSEVGKGTTFKVYLPRVEAEPDAVLPSAVRAASLKGTETILLVEDDAPLRKLTQAILKKGGYTVLSAGHSDEAFLVCAEYKGPIHILVSDVVMPGMNGHELAERMKSAYPDMKVLYVSGYTDDTVVRHGVLDRSMAFLQKPFTALGLLSKVRAVLDSGK